MPNFDYSTHVRFFKSEAEVRDRYGKLLDITTVELISKPIFANVSARQYLGSVRYATRKRNWKRLLGLLGVNKFAWHGGWFLFCGEKRQIHSGFPSS